MARPQQAVLIEDMMAQIDKMSKKMSPQNVTTEAEIRKLILVTHSFLLKFAFLSEAWKMLNVTSLLKDTSGSSGDLKKTEHDIWTGQIREIIIKHEISGTWTNMICWRTKLYALLFFKRNLSESLKESANIQIQVVSWYSLLWIQKDISQCISKELFSLRRLAAKS